MKLLRPTRLLVSVALALVLASTLSLGSAQAQPVETAPTSQAPLTTTDPIDEAPPILLTPKTAVGAETADDDGISVLYLVAVIVLPLIGVAILVWFWFRTKRIAEARRTARAAAADRDQPSEDRPAT